MSKGRRPLRFAYSNCLLLTAVVSLASLVSPRVLAEDDTQTIQRSFINPSFELPAVGTNCYVTLTEDQVPGWQTSHDAMTAPKGTCSFNVNPTYGRLIEVWSSVFKGVSSSPNGGQQFAEINAVQSSRIYQSVCLLSGETFNWKFYYRRRESASEAMQFDISPVTDPKGDSATKIWSGSAPAEWDYYDGSYNYTGPTGILTVGFKALSEGASGNLIDQIQIELLASMIEFSEQSASDQEKNATAANVPKIRISGLLAEDLPVNIVTSSDDAVLGVDYMTPGNQPEYTITIPAGNYDGTQPFDAGVTIPPDNTDIQPNRTINIAIKEYTQGRKPYIISSMTLCDGAPINNVSYTIIDDDAGIELNKVLAGDRFFEDDQFQLSVQAPDGSTQSIDTTGTQSDVAGKIHISDIQTGTYQLSELMADGAPVDDQSYSTSYNCINTKTDSPTVLPNDNGNTFQVTPVAGDAIICTFTNKPSIRSFSLDKSSSYASASKAGDVIDYNFSINYDGDVAINNVAVSDTLLGPNGVNCASTELQASGTVACTGHYTLTQTDVDKGMLNNQATASAATLSARTFESEIATNSITIAATPGLSFKKTAVLNDLNGNDLLDTNETITYTFDIANTGNVTLTNVTVSDTMLPGSSFPAPATLAPGGKTSFSTTYTPNKNDFNSAVLYNTATASGTAPDGTQVEATSSASIKVNALVIFSKDGVLNDVNGNGFTDPEDTISYTFVISNGGAAALSNLSIVDPLLSGANVVITSHGPDPLAAGENATFTAIYQLTQEIIDKGVLNNTAHGTAEDSEGNLLETGEVTASNKLVLKPSMSVVKTAVLDDTNGNGLLDPGEELTYTFDVTNDGNVTLTGVTVDDPLLLNAGVDIPTVPGPLAPGESTTFDAKYTPTLEDLTIDNFVNTATGKAQTEALGEIIAGEGSASYETGIPNLSLVKTGKFVDVDGNNSTDPGDEIIYVITIVNNGKDTVKDVAPVDEGPTFAGNLPNGEWQPFTPASATLAPGESQEFTSIYVLTEQDVLNAAGVQDGIINNAGVSSTYQDKKFIGKAEGGSKVTLPDRVFSKEIRIIKRALIPAVHRGERVPFVLNVLNASTDKSSGQIAVVDKLPPGFRYIQDSASRDGQIVTPVVSGQNIRFEGINLKAQESTEIKLQALVLSSVGPGKQTNRANAYNQEGQRVAEEARADVEIIAEPVFDCGDVIGKVFDDKNWNGYQDEGELGLPGVRLATVNGELITTDQYGRFHVPCAALPDQRVGSNYILKLDKRTLPVDYTVTTENPRVVRLSAGKMVEINFGATKEDKIKSVNGDVSLPKRRRAFP